MDPPIDNVDPIVQQNELLKFALHEITMRPELYRDYCRKISADARDRIMELERSEDTLLRQIADAHKLLSDAGVPCERPMKDGSIPMPLGLAGRVAALVAELMTKTCPRCHIDGYWHRATRLAEQARNTEKQHAINAVQALRRAETLLAKFAELSAMENDPRFGMAAALRCKDVVEYFTQRAQERVKQEDR